MTHPISMWHAAVSCITIWHDAVSYITKWHDAVSCITVWHDAVSCVTMWHDVIPRLGTTIPQTLCWCIIQHHVSPCGMIRYHVYMA